MIISLHERFGTLLPNNNDIVCNHHRNIEILLIEHFKWSCSSTGEASVL